MIFFYQGRERRNWRPGNQRSSWRIGKCELLTSDVCSVLIYFRLHKITVRSPNISTVRDLDRENYFVTHTESRRLKQFNFIQQLQTNDICIIRVIILISIRLCRAYVHQPQSARKYVLILVLVFKVSREQSITIIQQLYMFFGCEEEKSVCKQPSAKNEQIKTTLITRGQTTFPRFLVGLDEKNLAKRSSILVGKCFKKEFSLRNARLENQGIFQWGRSSGIPQFYLCFSTQCVQESHARAEILNRLQTRTTPL